MNIAVNARYLVKGQLGGIGKFSLEVLSRLVGRHPEHRFYFLFDRPFAAEFVFGPNVVPVVLYPPGHSPVLQYLWFELRVAQFLRTHPVDVFLSPDGKTCLSTQVPRLTVVHDLAFEHFPRHLPWSERWYLRHFSPKFARSSERLVAVSAATRQELRQQYGVQEQKVELVYQAASECFRPTTSTEQQHFRKHFTRGHEYLLYIGSKEPRKNLTRVLQAFDQYKAVTQQPLKLLVVTARHSRRSAQLVAHEVLEHPEDVVFCGMLSNEELRQAYGAAVGLVYVPLLGGFGMPVLEAQRCNCPVITSSVSSLPEVAGEGALKVTPESVPAIAAAMTRLSTDRKLRQHLALAGQQNAARFCWDRSASEMWKAILKTAKTAPEATAA